MTQTSSTGWQLVTPGVWRLTIGQPELITPTQLHTPTPKVNAIAQLPAISSPPLAAETISATARPRGLAIEIPIADTNGVEQFFGGGLQLTRFNQSAKKRALRVNSDPVGDAGDSHAPVPFYVSSAGYGIYVDSARYVEFYLGSSKKLSKTVEPPAPGTTAADEIAISTESLYAARASADRTLLIDVPAAQGVTLYLFAGPTMRNVVQRYNLYSGGGCLPPMWGLGVWYRAFGRASESEAITLAESLRKSEMPCDVFGLEPGWQSQAYSCSFTWNPTLFPNPRETIQTLRRLGFNINLWEHVFVHPTSPMYEPLKPHSGDYEVWGGLVPDLAVPAASKIFADFHRTHFVEQGITGFKLDECDGSDFIVNLSWSFPEASAFPSGMDGEQMHSAIGLLYQRAIEAALTSGGQRTYSAVRSSGPFAAPLPFVLYSDLYDHRDFIRGILTSSFCGLLWTPEVRDATSREDLIRRIQSVVLSPQALINAWYCKNPPWLQFDREKNNADDLLPDASELQAIIRKLLNLRMALLPYLYTAFAKYRDDGTPPFRPLVLDFPGDEKTHKLSDEYLMGDDFLVAPIFAGQTERAVYLPAGDWHHYDTGEKFAGGESHTFPVMEETLLLFVRTGRLIPWAKPVQFVDAETVFEITVRAYGDGPTFQPAVLYEDDGMTFDHEAGRFNWVTINANGSVARDGKFSGKRFRINF